MRDQTLLWIGCGGCPGETQALLGVEGQGSDLLDLIDVDGLRLLWHPSLAEHDLQPVHHELMEGFEYLTMLCVEGSVALAEGGMFDLADEAENIIGLLAQRPHDAELPSWATAPRYGHHDRVMQLGPLPELLIAGDPLAADLVAAHGTSALVRQLVRWTRAAANLRLMREWLGELESCLGQSALQPPRPADIDPDAQGFGHANATRGTLMHWMKLTRRKIAAYRVITPTTWNASPRDTHAVPGHFEQSLVGLPAGETGRCIRALVLGSHDPCLVCTTQ